MLLSIDIGNTNVVLGVSSGNEILHHWRIRTVRDITPDELGVVVSGLLGSEGLVPELIRHSIICCVVPPVLKTFVHLCRGYFRHEPLIVGPEIDIGMPNLYDNPKEVGVDRLVNAVAAYRKYSTALVIVDLGTATTFDCVTRDGSYMGGAISPGIWISAEALFQKTAGLPRIQILQKPESVIARDTINSMNSGIIYGYAGLVDGIVNRMKKECGGKIRVVATGGLAPILSEVSDTIDHVEPLLTLEGLISIAERNMKRIV